MALKSDGQGFLIGSPAEWSRSQKMFMQIRDEIRGLRKDFKSGPNTKALVKAADAVSRQAASVSKAVASSRRVAAAPKVKQTPVAPTRTAAVRGPNGRFISAVKVQPVAPAPRAPAVTHEVIDIAARDAERLRNAPRRDPDLVRRQTAAMARPQPMASTEKQKVATPSRSHLPTVEQRQEDRAADRALREDEKAAAKAIKDTETAEKKRLAEEERNRKKGTAEEERQRRLNIAATEQQRKKQAADAEKQRKEDEAKQSFGSRVVGGATSAIGSAPVIDPTIAALHEVGHIVSPLGRGVSKLFGGGQKTWLQKVWAEVRGQRKDQSSYHKAEQKTLQQIDDKTGGGSGKGGFGGMLGSLVSKVSGAGLLGRLLGGAGGGLLRGGLLRAGKGLLGGVLRGGGGLLRRLPLIGGLFAGGSAIASMAGFNDDPNASAAENHERRFAGAGSGIGTIIGGAIGSLLGPVGTIVGGVLGDKVGELVGKWLSTLDWEKIGGEITDKWDAAVKVFSNVWDSVSGWFKDKLGIVANVASKASDAIKSATGIDVKASAAAVGQFAKRYVQTGDEVAKAAGSYVADRAGKMAAPLAKAAIAAKNWVLGNTSKQFESGSGGAGTVSTGKGDAGGASYGTYQMSSKRGTVQDFIKHSDYVDDFAGLTPGSPEFNAVWKEIAANDPKFGAAQHEFIKSTHFDPQMAALKKGGINLSGRGAAVQDAVWSTSVQFGGNTSLIQKALRGQDVSKMSDAQIASAIQDYKIAHNSALFASSDAKTQAGTLKREGAEKQKLLALAAPLPSTSAAPTLAAPKVQEAAQSVPTSATGPVPLEVRVSKDTGDVGQNVSDRKIARIVTGGLSQ